MENLFDFNEVTVMAIVSVCAMIATFLPEPKTKGFYSFIYNVINKIAFNFGKAKNRDIQIDKKDDNINDK